MGFLLALWRGCAKWENKSLFSDRQFDKKDFRLDDSMKFLYKTFSGYFSK
jgi:muconolactone delta-isomerase